MLALSVGLPYRCNKTGPQSKKFIGVIVSQSVIVELVREASIPASSNRSIKQVGGRDCGLEEAIYISNISLNWQEYIKQVGSTGELSVN
jgi:hypothetical protein